MEFLSKLMKKNRMFTREPIELNGFHKVSSCINVIALNVGSSLYTTSFNSSSAAAADISSSTNDNMSVRYYRFSIYLINVVIK